MASQGDEGAKAVEQELLVLVEQRLGVTAGTDTPLTALGVDSLRLADFVADLERHFDLDADQELFEVENLGELAAYIREHRRG